MSKFTKLMAGAILALGIAAAAPQAAMAQHWHGGGWGRGWHGGGWGWGGFAPGFALGLGVASAPYWYGYGPYAYGGSCGWVHTRVWRHGFWVIRRVWRCW
jgi:hypothetical protein